MNHIFDSYTQSLNTSNEQISQSNFPKQNDERFQPSISDHHEEREGRKSGQRKSSQLPTKVSRSEVSLKMLLDWSLKNNVEDNKISQIMELAENLTVPMENVTVEYMMMKSDDSLFYTSGIIDAFRSKLNTEPIGFLHLERLSFTPVGIERGELVHSVPLSPGEEVNIIHKEWSNTSEEFQRIVTDYMENFSEEGVSEKNDLAQSSNSQQQHTDGYNLSVTASGGYGPVNITTSAGYNASNSSTSSAQLSRTSSMTITRKASARVTKEHKTSFKVASASGTEDQAVRKIKNVFTDKATRCDYYQLLRKWRVDFTRYGLRLTYDITIPEPGIDILSKIEEINSIEADLAKGFPDFVSPKKAPFYLTADQLTRENFDLKASEYDVTVDSPPDDEILTQVHVEKKWTSEEAGYYSLDINVDDKYQIAYASISTQWITLNEWGYLDVMYQGPNSEPDPINSGTGLYNETKLIGRSNTTPVIYFASNVKEAEIYVDLTFKLKPAEFKAWQFKTWETIRDAALSLYDTNRVMLEKKLTQLQEELGFGRSFEFA